MKKSIWFCLFIPALIFTACSRFPIQTGEPARAGAGSFPAGTEVLTSTGSAAIQDIGEGTEVYAWNWSTGKWSMVKVTGVKARAFEGALFRITAGPAVIDATESHPIWVVRGSRLAEGPAAQGVAPEERGITERGRWVEAWDLLTGDVLLLRSGDELVVEKIESRHGSLTVYDLELSELHSYAVHEMGVLVAAHWNPPKPASGSSGGGCFLAGTDVLTASGPLAIQKVAQGTRVYARGGEAPVWELKEVLGLESLDYEGDVVSLRAGDAELKVTGNHPIWVTRGRDLAERPAVRDVSREERGMSADGRWVEARDLRQGDVLLLRSGEETTVEALSSRLRRAKVYNLQVAGFHSYAVHESGILVHNKGSKESDEPSTGGYYKGEEPSAAMSTEESAPETALSETSDEPSGEKTKSEETGAARSAASSRATPSESGLRAGYADDNQQFNYFLGFLEQYGAQVEHLPMDVTERVILKIRDKNGKSLPNAVVSVTHENRELCRGLTHADGSFTFFPSEYDRAFTSYQLTVESLQQTVTRMLDRQGSRAVEVRFPLPRPELQSVPLDLLFILDTTGSMGEEIERLKATIEIIYLNLSSLASRPTIRFGMVLYKDRRDEYVTQVVPFTDDLSKFQKELDEVRASGGGDAPEDLQAALQAALEQMSWNRDGVRLAFVVTDAPPHLDYRQDYTYVKASRDARDKGIKIFTVGTGGLNLMGEYVMRQVSQYTGARYIFLTYGESGESAGGRPGSVSHHTGANYETDKLEAIIIRFTKEELQHLTDQPIEAVEEYFQARKITDEEKEETLRKLFAMASQQLIDYSSLRIAPKTPVAVLPISAAVPSLGLVSEYFTEQLLFTLGVDEILRETFLTVERKDLQAVLEELELQMTELVEDSQAARVGELLGAEMLFSGKLYQKADSYELFLKLLRVETGEILSITKAVLAKELGL